ncbi:hypothetical protein BDK51DRAFT_52298 [Blyttiomyces helicus]|uniref:Uncharacterized protein n=1 Tax=Blyttiomyces helicus TaxID=388810 RepID=A0A4P9WG92_9FUNG|nr:hypothetical protein BDK51DRAFT_52298 [Blyttiomyces helicus]|eukprot:RKO91352.1 hypothetical protein BDK51DRAFT_52298 [Blyttiomyces helicus]
MSELPPPHLLHPPPRPLSGLLSPTMYCCPFRQWRATKDLIATPLSAFGHMGGEPSTLLSFFKLAQLKDNLLQTLKTTTDEYIKGFVNLTAIGTMDLATASLYSPRRRNDPPIQQIRLTDASLRLLRTAHRHVQNRGSARDLEDLDGELPPNMHPDVSSSRGDGTGDAGGDGGPGVHAGEGESHDELDPVVCEGPGDGGVDTNPEDSDEEVLRKCGVHVETGEKMHPFLVHSLRITIPRNDFFPADGVSVANVSA